jgi:DNA-binding transcriptional LysR family regulator
MSIEKLEYFYLVAKYNSLTKASTELYVGISSLSSSIKSLENELGFDLFVRQGKKLVLSTAGEEILPYVKEILHNAKKIYFPIYDQLDRYFFKVGISEPILQAITHEQSVEEQLYKVTFVKSSPLDVFNNLRNQEVNLGISSSKVTDPQFERTLLFQTEVLLATSCTLLAEHLRGGTPQALENVPFLILEDHLEHESLTRRVVDCLKIAPPFIYCPSTLAIYKWLCANKGVLVIHSIEKDLLEDDALRFLPLPNHLVTDYYLYKKKDDPFTFDVEGAKQYLKSVYDKNNR